MPIERTDGVETGSPAPRREEPPKDPKLPEPVSKWEIASIPAAGVFYAMHNMDAFAWLGISEEELPDFMIICFTAAATARAMVPRVPGWIRSAVAFFRSLKGG